MEWLVDGMNLIGSRPDGWWRDRAGARRRLVEELRAFLEARSDEGTVVFDGRPDAGEGLDEGTPLRVLFAPGGPNAADRRLTELVTERRGGSEVTVVTSDGALADAVRRLGAAVIGVSAFRQLLEVR